MKVVIQRSKNASVSVNGKLVGSIEKGMVVLVAFTQGDTSKEIDYVIDKMINLRIFDDEFGVMNKSLLEVSGEVLSISQFTLYADTKKGRRPSYTKSLNSKEAIKLYEEFNQKLSKKVKTSTGIFGADMKVSLTNDGPVTIIIEKNNNN